MTEVERLPAIPLTKAASDPKLLRLGKGLWPEQMKLLRSIEQGPSLQIVAWGRGASKTTLAQVAAIHACLFRPELLDCLLPGERGAAANVSTNEKQAIKFIDGAKWIIGESEILSELVESSTQDEIRFKNNTALMAFPCTARGARGWRLFFLVFDEFAHHNESEGASSGQADSLFNSLRPSQITFGELARTLVISSPAGTQGKFYELFQAAHEGDLPGAVAHHAATWDVNPTVSETYLATERQLLGEEAFWTEYGARFVGGVGKMFEKDALNNVSRVNAPADPAHGTGWVTALDPASGGGDAFGVATVGRDVRPGYTGRLLVGQLDRYLPRKGAASGKRTRQERDLWIGKVLDGVAETVLRFNASVISDQHIPGVVQDELGKRGIGHVQVRPWTTTNRLQAFRSLRSRVETERIEIPWDDVLVTELQRVRTKYRGGSQVVEIGRSGDSHGDLAVALALAVNDLDNNTAQQAHATLSRPSGILVGHPPQARPRPVASAKIRYAPAVSNEGVIDFLVDVGNPAALDATLQALPGVNAFVVGGPEGPFAEEDGHYVVRIFGGKIAAEMFEFMVGQQGYCRVIGPREALV